MEKKFDSGLESVENAPKSGRPVCIFDEIISKVNKTVERNARYTVHDIA